MVQPSPRVFDPLGLAGEDPASPVAGAMGSLGVQEPEKPEDKVLKFHKLQENPRANAILNEEGGIEKVRQFAISNGYRTEGFPSEGPTQPLIPFDQTAAGTAAGTPKEEFINGITWTANGSMENAWMFNVAQRKRAGDVMIGKVGKMSGLQPGVSEYFQGHVERMQEIEGQFVPTKIEEVPNVFPWLPPVREEKESVYKFGNIQEQYDALTPKGQKQANGLLTEYNERWMSAGGYYSDVDFTGYANPKDKLEKVFGIAASLEAMRWSKDPRQKQSAENFIHWIDSLGGDITWQFRQMTTAIQAQERYDQFASMGEATTPAGSANEVFGRISGMLEGGQFQEYREKPKGQSVTEMHQHYKALGAPIEDDTNTMLALLRAQVEKKAKIYGVTVEEIGKWPVTKKEAWELFDVTFELFKEARMHATVDRSRGVGEGGVPGITYPGDIGFRNKLSSSLEDDAKTQGWEAIVNLVSNIRPDPKVMGPEGALSFAEMTEVFETSLSGGYINAKDAAGHISIPLKILELAMRPSEFIGTTVDAFTMNTNAVVGFATTRGAFVDFWEYLDWAMWNMKHNPNAVFQEDKDIYDHEMQEKAKFYDEAGLVGGGHRLLLRAGSAYDQVRGLAPNYDEGAYPVKATIIRGTHHEKIGKSLFDSISDGWSAFTGETEGVYLGQALMNVIAEPDPDDRVGSWSKTIIGLAFDIAIDPISWLTGGQLTAAQQLTRRVRMFNILEKAGEWSKSANSAWSGVRAKAISAGKEVPKGPLTDWLNATKSVKDLGLASWTEITKAAKEAFKFKKHLNKLPKVAGFRAKFRTKARPTFGDNPWVVTLNAGKSKNASELVESLGGAGLKPGHLDELKSFGTDEILVVFRNEEAVLAAEKAGVITKDAVATAARPANEAGLRKLIPKNARILGDSKGGHGQLILKTSEPLNVAIHGGRTVVTLEDGVALNPRLRPAFETVKAMFGGNDEMAKWIFSKMKTDPRFRKDGLAALLDNPATLNEVRTLLHKSGVNVAAKGDLGLEQTRLVLGALNKPIERIVAFRGSSLNFMPQRLQGWLKHGGSPTVSGQPLRDAVVGGFSRQAAWKAGFEHTPKIKLWGGSTGPVFDPVIGAVTRMRREGKKILSKMDSMVVPDKVKNLSTLMQFSGKTIADWMGVVRHWGLLRLQAKQSVALEMESVSRMSAQSTADLVPIVGGRVAGRNLGSFMTASREIYDMPLELVKTLSEYSLKSANRERYVVEMTVQWGLDAKGNLLGGKSVEAQNEIYKALSHMVEAKNFDEGIAQLALARKFDSGDVMLGNRKITIKSVQRMKTVEEREAAFEAVAKALDDVDIDNARKLMDPYRKEYRVLKGHLDEMGKIGEEAGLLVAEEKYAPHIWRSSKARDNANKKGGVLEHVIQPARSKGTSPGTRMSGHGIKRDGPPTILEAQIHGLDPVLDMRELFYARTSAFLEDLYKTQLFKAFAQAHGVTPVTSATVAATLLRSAGEQGDIVELLAPLKARANKLASDLQGAGRAKRDLNKTQQALEKKLEKMGVPLEQAYKVINEEGFEGFVDFLAGKYSKGKAVGTRETLYRAEAVGVEAAGDSGGVVFFSPDKSYVKLYESEGRGVVSVPKPDEVFDIRVPSNEKIVRKWLKGKLKKYSGNEDVLTKDLKQLERSLEIKGPQGVSSGLANVSIIENTLKGETASIRSGSGERLFMDAHDIKAMTIREAGRAREEYSFALTPAESTRLRKATKGKARADNIRVEVEDATELFGAGAKKTTYTDPSSGGKLTLVTRPGQQRKSSVLDFVVPEKGRGSGVGTSLVERALRDNPSLQAQVSSRAAATILHRKGLRLYDKPKSTLKDVFKDIDKKTSAHMVAPDAPGAVAARADAEALGDVFNEIDRKAQAINETAARIAQDFDIHTEQVLGLLNDDIPAFLKGQGGGTKRELTFIENRIAELQKTVDEVRVGAGGVGVEALEAEKATFVLHRTRLLEMRAALKGWGLRPKEEAAVMMTLYGVPSASFLSIAQAEKFLAAGEVAVASIVNSKKFYKGTLEGVDKFKFDRTYKKHYVRLLEMDIPGGEVAEWAKALEDIYIPAEDALVLHSVGIEYGLSDLEVMLRGAMVDNIKKFFGALAYSTTLTKTMLTAKNLAMVFGRRNQIDMILKLTQASGAMWIHPEMMREFAAWVKGELTVIKQATGGVVDAKQFLRDAQAMLPSTWKQQVNIKAAQKATLSEAELARLTGAEKEIKEAATAAAKISDEMLIHAGATGRRGKVGVETVVGGAIAVGLPGVPVIGLGGAEWLGAAAVIGQKGSPGLTIPQLTEWIFPWGTRAAEKTDNTLRAYLAFLEVKKGSGINQAIHNALDLGRNYDNLSPFERNYIAQGPVMFWNFMKQNLKSLKTVALIDPGKLTFWPKFISYVGDEVPDDLKEDWASALGMIYTKDGGYFVPTDMDALHFFDFIPTILAAAGKEYLGGEEGAMRKALDYTKVSILEQSSPIFAGIAAQAVGEIPSAMSIGSTRFSKDTQRRIVEILGKPEDEDWRNDAFLSEALEPDGKGGFKIRKSLLGGAFWCLSFYVPFAQLGNNITKNRLLMELPDGYREFYEKFGFFKKFEYDAQGRIRKLTGLAREGLARTTEALRKALPMLSHDGGYPKLLTDAAGKLQLTPDVLAVINALVQSGEILRMMEARARDFSTPTKGGGDLPILSTGEKEAALGRIRQ